MTFAVRCEDSAISEASNNARRRATIRVRLKSMCQQPDNKQVRKRSRVQTCLFRKPN